MDTETFYQKVGEIFPRPEWKKNAAGMNVCLALVVYIFNEEGYGEEFLITSTTHRTVWFRGVDGSWEFRSNHMSEWRPSVAKIFKDLGHVARVCADYAWVEFGADGGPPAQVVITGEEVNLV